MKNPLSPLASICLGVVKGWINVARNGRGGQIDEKGTAWTRLPAEQLRDQLSREFLVEVSTRSIQRALKELETENHLRREQKWKHRYRRDYWYALPLYEENLNRFKPRTIAGNYKTAGTRPTRTIETTEVTHQVLSTQKTITPVSRWEPKKKKTEREDELKRAIETCMTRKQPHRGFGTPNTPRKEVITGTDGRGMEQKEVWVNGRMHLVVD